MNENQKFVYNQLKFMYGKYFDIAINNQTINSNFLEGDVYISDILKNNVNKIVKGERNNYLFYFIEKYWMTKIKNPDKYILRIYFEDRIDKNLNKEFYITHNRLYNTDNEVLFPLKGYHNPIHLMANDNILFKNKNNKIIWRGSSTGSNDINNNIRYIIVSKNFSVSKNIDIGFSNFCQCVYDNNKIKFDILKKNSMTKEEIMNYKFILNLEGNDWSSSFLWALSSNSCPLHNYPFNYENYIFGKGLKPFVHFVPIKSDGSDLLEMYHWCLNNMNKCEEIANNGKKYMQQYLDVRLYNIILCNFVNIYPLKDL
jgi:hypothetical protein